MIVCCNLSRNMIVCCTMSTALYECLPYLKKSENNYGCHQSYCIISKLLKSENVLTRCFDYIFRMETQLENPRSRSAHANSHCYQLLMLQCETLESSTNNLASVWTLYASAPRSTNMDNDCVIYLRPPNAHKLFFFKYPYSLQADDFIIQLQFIVSLLCLHKLTILQLL